MELGKTHHERGSDSYRRYQKIKRSLFETVKKRKLSLFGHVMRHDSLQRDLLEDMVEDKRGRGRKRLQWGDNNTQWTGLTFEKAKRYCPRPKEMEVRELQRQSASLGKYKCMTDKKNEDISIL